MLRFRHRFNQHFSTDPSFYEFIAIYLYGTEVFSEKRRYDVTSFGIVGKHPFLFFKIQNGSSLCLGRKFTIFNNFLPKNEGLFNPNPLIKDANIFILR